MTWGKLRHHACPRCRGTMYRDKDRFGAFLQCLQCGHVIDVSEPGPMTQIDLVAKLEKRTGTKVAQRAKEEVNAG